MNNLKAMLETMEEIEKLTASLNKDVTKNRKQMRLDAISKIQSYFQEKLELCQKYNYHPRLELEGISISPYSSHHNLHVFFEPDSTVTLWQLGGCSSIEINNFCNLTEEDMLRNNGETSTWNEGFLPIIEKWQQIKEIFEKSLETDIKKHCADLTKIAQDNLTVASYLKNFEV